MLFLFSCFLGDKALKTGVVGIAGLAGEVEAAAFFEGGGERGGGAVCCGAEVEGDLVFVEPGPLADGGGGQPLLAEEGDGIEVTEETEDRAED